MSMSWSPSILRCVVVVVIACLFPFALIRICSETIISLHSLCSASPFSCSNHLFVLAIPGIARPRSLFVVGEGTNLACREAKRPSPAAPCASLNLVPQLHAQNRAQQGEGAASHFKLPIELPGPCRCLSVLGYHSAGVVLLVPALGAQWHRL